jgi:hypothetical protein
MALAYHFDRPTKSYLSTRLTRVEISDLQRLAWRTARVVGGFAAIGAVMTILMAIRFWAFVPHSWH